MSPSVVAKMKRTCGGGSSSVFFVDDENLELGRDRLELDRLDYRPHVLDLVVRRGIKFHDIQRATSGDLLAVDALPARLDAVWRSAVERLCEDAARRRLADAAGADEKVCVRDAVRLDRVTKGPDHMLLADDIVERHRTVL